MTDFIWRMPVYQAIQYDGENWAECKAFADAYEDWALFLAEDGTPSILDGTMAPVEPGDWIIGCHTPPAGSDEVHAIKPAAFAVQFMPAPWNPAPGQVRAEKSPPQRG